MKTKLLLIALIMSTTISFSTTNFAKPHSSSNLSHILKKLQQLGYRSFTEVEKKYNVYKIEAYDKNKQLCKIIVSSKTGKLITPKITRTNKPLLTIVENLEKTGHQVYNIELESKHAPAYYKAKIITPKGEYKRVYIHAKTGKISKTHSVV